MINRLETIWLFSCFFLAMGSGLVLGQQERELVFTFSGDIMAHNVNFNMDDFHDIYRDLQVVLQNDDLSFANLEFPVDEDVPYRTYPRFNVHPPYVEAAIEAGFQVFSLANNHSNDWGGDSMLATLRNMARFQLRYEVFHNGLRRNENQPWTMTEIPLGPHRIGFVSVTSLLNSREDLELIHFVPYHDFYNDISYEETADDFLEWISLQREKVDLLVLGIHDGPEYLNRPRAEKVSFYFQLAKSGVDIIWSHHPHVFQRPIQVNFDERKVMIMPSMGNLISGQIWNLDPEDSWTQRAGTGDSLLVQIRLDQGPRKLEITGMSVLPFTNYRDPEKGMVIRDFTQLLEDLVESPWQEYYQDRLEYLEDFLVPMEVDGSTIP